MPIDTQPSDLVFDQLLKPSKGRKKLSRGYRGWAIFLWKFQRSGGLTFPCENGKSEGVGGVLFEIPSVVGVWIFSGTTQFCVRACHRNFDKQLYGLRKSILLFE